MGWVGSWVAVDGEVGWVLYSGLPLQRTSVKGVA